MEIFVIIGYIFMAICTWITCFDNDDGKVVVNITAALAIGLIWPFAVMTWILRTLYKNR